MMLRAIRWFGIPCLCLAAVAFADTPKAQAQGGGFSIQFGTPSYGYGGYSRSYRPSYGYGYGSPSYGYNRHQSYYRGYSGHHPHRPHYDYHGPRVVPHGNHYHYVPGHYDLHRGHRGHHRH
ncbi:hypothetical protein Poly24_21300 [Rosistilla carotiformis]|uniref:Uncharacterized protein n=1 Tax=Rosistilla carotiformis TaxID=2528017 RepID=A0A518JS91_9BACT|nr:hypothetical protein [Rosistilla carotiformis]QDV68421.1 hypothetical protein Poly24_21300 [Rosistilla carotiformis]